MGEMRHRTRPCAECPWRRDVATGRFGPDRFEALAQTAGAPGAEAGLGTPMFACHKSAEGLDDACAGWLAVEGINHIGVRLAITQNALPAEVLEPPADWPDLYDSYAEMQDSNS